MTWGKRAPGRAPVRYGPRKQFRICKNRARRSGIGAGWKPILRSHYRSHSNRFSEYYWRVRRLNSFRKAARNRCRAGGVLHFRTKPKLSRIDFQDRCLKPLGHPWGEPRRQAASSPKAALKDALIKAMPGEGGRYTRDRYLSSFLVRNQVADLKLDVSSKGGDDGQ
jgi:hypothetical protein